MCSREAKRSLNFYQISKEDALVQLDSDGELGLSEIEAEKRLDHYGPNELEEGKRPSVVLRFLNQFRDLLIVVLIVAASLAYYLGDFKGGTILFIIVLVNALIGFYQEYKAEKILE